jgi:hypothetical protein
MGALSAIESPVLTGRVVSAALDDGEEPQRCRLRLVGAPVAVWPIAGVGMAGQPRASSIGECYAGATVAPGPLRLTRRGRLVMTVLAVLCVTVAVLMSILLASGGAQAANHGQSGGAYQGMHQIVVGPGQTLWSIASAAEPTADPRAVVQQIMSVNALTGTSIQAGQLLWVPRPAG